MTIEPRHSLLRESYHMSSASRQALSPCLRYCILQVELVAGLVQYMPIDWKVATPRTLLLSVGIGPALGGGVGAPVGGGVTGGVTGGVVLPLFCTLMLITSERVAPAE